MENTPITIGTIGGGAFATSIDAITFVGGGRDVLTITPDGRFVLGPGAMVDDAARAIIAACSNLWRSTHYAGPDDEWAPAWHLGDPE